MMEIANLTVKLSSDVEQAISGLQKTDAAVQKSAAVSGKESKKIEGFMGKWKMGWIAMSVAAVGTLYAIAKSSAVIGGYFSEFGMMVGDAFDAIGIAMSPILDPLMDFLWDAEEAFVEHVIPALETFANKVAEVAIPALKNLKDDFLALPANVKKGIVGIGAAAIVLAPIFGPLYILPAILLAKFRDKIPKIIETFQNTWSEIKSIYETFVKPIFESIKTFIDAIWNTIKLIFAAAFLTIKAIFVGDTELLRRVWVKFGERLREIWGEAWDSIKNLVGIALSTIITKLKGYKDKFVESGRNLPKAIIEGIGDIGATIWNAVKSGLSSVAGKISNWASGILGLSPTLLEIGAKIPKTLMTGAMNIPLNIERIINTRVTTPIIAHSGERFFGTKSATPSTTIVISPTIYISGEMRTDTDLRKLASDLSVYFKDEIKRQVRG